MQKQRFFDSIIRLFETYRKRMNRKRPKRYNAHLGHEVHRRLKQLSFLCKNIRSYETRIDKIIPRALGISSADMMKAKITGVAPLAAHSPKDIAVFGTLLFELELFVESFYLLAWRIRSILRHKKKYILPHLNTFEARGIRDVRNSLIEHPEDSQIFMQSFSCGGDRGPVLKNGRPAGDPWKIYDKGLWVNAKEFRDNLEKLLRKALED